MVLTLALVAIFIPINHALADKRAHATKEKTIVRLDLVGSAVNANIRPTITIKNASTLYSALRKDIAHFAILEAIFCIFAVPASCLLTIAARYKAYNKPTTHVIITPYNTMCLEKEIKKINKGKLIAHRYRYRLIFQEIIAYKASMLSKKPHHYRRDHITNTSY